jgi:hypothetical protein
LPGEATRARGFVPLTGADGFLRAFDHEIRRTAGASHVSQLVLRLGPGFDPGIFAKLVEELAGAQPIVRAPIGRRFGLGRPVYRTRAAARRPTPRVEVIDLPGDESPPVPELFLRRLNEPISLRRGELLRFDVVRYAGGAAGTDLAASWAHLLFDGAGSERFVRWLDECYRGVQRPSALPDPGELSCRDEERPGMRERGERALAWQRWMDGFGTRPLRSLAGPLRRTRQALRYDVLTFSQGETERVVETASRRAGFLTPMLFYMAATIRAHHAVFRDRGVDPGSFVLPLPVNLRPKGREGAIFRTHTSLLWFQALPGQVDDFDALLATLKRQRVDAIRADHVENCVHAMDFALLAPRRLYTRMARAAQRGELCSCFFAYTGEFLGGQDRFLGAEIRNGFHVAPVPPSPGSCVAMSLFDGRLNVTHVFQEDAISDREREIFREQLRRDLTG